MGDHTGEMYIDFASEPKVNLRKWHDAITRGAIRSLDTLCCISPEGTYMLPQKLLSNLEKHFGVWDGSRFNYEGLPIFYSEVENNKLRPGIRDIVRYWYELGKDN